MRVVICGGGVIGACTAYFLARRGVDVSVVERADVAAAASGKAGGFLALDWCAGTPPDALARRSFALHAVLQEETGADWSYRRMNAAHVTPSNGYESDRAVPTGPASLIDDLISPVGMLDLHRSRARRLMLRAPQARRLTIRLAGADVQSVTDQLELRPSAAGHGA